MRSAAAVRRPRSATAPEACDPAVHLHSRYYRWHYAISQAIQYGRRSRHFDRPPGDRGFAVLFDGSDGRIKIRMINTVSVSGSYCRSSHLVAPAVLALTGFPCFAVDADLRVISWEQ